ncbi:MAG: DEAD/DEAH box helicase family protein [bacterium]|nr:DEAD/DEAH box helicase family protein [bacterium]
MNNSLPKTGTFDYIDQQIRKGSVQVLGHAFERLCKFYLENAPKYRGEFKHVWHWRDWPKRWGPDTGIDLIAETTDGEIWAIQAKGINPDRSIPKSELDSFLSESNRPEIKFRLIIATTDDIGANARRTIAGQQIPVGFVLRGDLLGEELQWPAHLGEKPSIKPKKSPRPHQEEAIKNVLNGFKKSNRGKLILACGTGKTLTSLWIHESLKSQRTLFLVPSLSLINQTLLEWSANAKHDFDRIVVCSDDTVAHSGEDHAISSTADLGIEVTTNTEDIARFLNKEHSKPVIVFCTYQSSDRITEVQKLGAPTFDLVIADEAHRTTGFVESNFAAVLDDSKIKSKKRLFMTATPRYFTDRVIEKSKELEYEMASMDDEKKYGSVFYQLTFGKAIKRDLLSDYQVVIISANEKERKMAEEAVLVRTNEGLFTDARTFAAQIGLAKAIKKYDLHKIITFHSSVAKAKRFADTEVLDSLPSVIKKLPMSSRPSGEIWTSHISGLTPTGRRKTLLNQFAAFPNTTRAILTNCACLGEGVDVPTLDGVAFIDPKRSQVDIIQAVGRVIRKAAGVGVGTIVIPVFIDESEDEETVLTSSAFKPVWQVIRALRAHDEVLAEELDELRLKLSKRSPYGGKVKLPAAIKVDIPTLVFKDFERAFNVRTVEATTPKPNLTIDQILAWADDHHKRTKVWPQNKSGKVFECPDETWALIDFCLSKGGRGLRGGSSIAKLLQEKRGKRNKANLPNITVDEILNWADFYYKSHKEWPTRKSGEVKQSGGVSWEAVDTFLVQGIRGLPGNSSLAKLLSEKRGVRNIGDLKSLYLHKILKWADHHYKRTGKWPKRNSGKVLMEENENWKNIDYSLIEGRRGLSGGSSVAKLLEKNRNVRNRSNSPKLTIRKIIKWANQHHRKTSEWPNESSGYISKTGDNWSAVSMALRVGLRGLPSGSSLAKLLTKKKTLNNNRK